MRLRFPVPTLSDPEPGTGGQEAVHQLLLPKRVLGSTSVFEGSTRPGPPSPEVVRSGRPHGREVPERLAEDDPTRGRTHLLSRFTLA